MNRSRTPALVLVAMMIVAFVTLVKIGEYTVAVTLVAGMTAGFLAGVLHPPKPKGIYRMSEDDKNRTVASLDEMHGFSTIRFIVEDAVNRDRGTHLEYHVQELRKGAEARTRQKEIAMR